MTGRVRPRLGWFGRVYMQVEIRAPKPRGFRAPPPSKKPYDPWENGSYTYWRDARPADFISTHVLSGVLDTVTVKQDG